LRTKTKKTGYRTKKFAEAAWMLCLILEEGQSVQELMNWMGEEEVNAECNKKSRPGQEQKKTVPTRSRKQPVGKRGARLE
jgi:hypothetical protein